MIIKFWGTRGSVPTPGRRTAFFGGNTNCVEIRADDHHVVIMDCGTGARPLGLEVRAGLHTGEVELLGGKVAGIAVNIGARVAQRAGAGEVLVSGTVKDLVAGSGIAFADRGVAELKGIPGEWRLSVVVP